MAEQLKTSNSTTLSDFIWKNAEDLWGDFRHTDFARIMLPLLLLRRLECVLEPTREAVTVKYQQEKDTGIDLGLILPHISGYSFYNTSSYTLATLGATDTRANLEDYIRQFSGNVRIVFDEFGFANTSVKLDRAKLLYRMVKNFAAMDLHPNVVSERVISNVYEHLIRKFGASVNEKAGEFMTPRDVVRLVTKLVLHTDEDIFTKKGVIRTIYDPACGTAGFLSDAIAQIKEFNPKAKIVPFGQELDPETHALAMTSMMIQGFETDKIKQGSTLSSDQLPGERFHYGLANPPFGFKWEKDQKAVLKERQELGFAGRFGAGLPRISDGSMLFLQTLVSKMEAPEHGGGRVGIVLSGSPLFNGGAGSGESEIRRWLLEQDFVEAIFSLPNDMFFNTGIGTYVWLLSNKKAPERKGKVQLINLSNIWTAMRKSEGSKRRYLSDEQIDDSLREYDAFTESSISKIFDSTAFGYRRITVERPFRFMFDGDEDGIDRAVTTHPDGSISTRWGKTAARLPSVNTRNGIRQFDIEKQKQAKGYVFVAEVAIDSDGNVAFSGQSQSLNLNHGNQHAEPDENRQAEAEHSRSMVTTLYWHIDCKADPDTCVTLGSEVRRMLGDLQACDDWVAQAEQDWDGWQQLLDLTLEPNAFTQSGQIQQAHGVMPWLLLMALKFKGFAGIDIGIATEHSRELSAELKDEPEVLAFFGTNLDILHPVKNCVFSKSWKRKVNKVSRAGLCFV